ncbi:hypothetical protein [Nisaea sp.]|uniref:hypothetical protein n=1 Tax=Nisaea sp. TaxID=2024842 RepID=UPI002B268C02|nr:hypothetical protein [Nisaea sp.]
MVALPNAAWANVGVPIFFLTVPIFAVSLVPIVWFEGAYLSSHMQMRKGEAIWLSLVANLVSTLVGVPFAWVAVAIVAEMGRDMLAPSASSALDYVLDAPWVLPGPGPNWIFPFAYLVLLVPFFFASWKTEFGVIVLLRRRLDRFALNLHLRNANLITYGMMAVWTIAMLVWVWYWEVFSV